MNRLLVASDNDQAWQNVRAAFPANWSVDTVSCADTFWTFNGHSDPRRNRIGFMFIDVNFLCTSQGSPRYRDFEQSLKRIWERFPGTEIVVMCPQEEVRLAVMAVKLGAIDYIAYPIDPEEVRLIVDSIEEQRRHQSELDHLRDDSWQGDGNATLRTNSPLMRRVFEELRLVAPTRSTVLLHGETGTGKGVLARLIHTHSSRRENPFISVHCGAIPDALIESELFGHERGAFTGADRLKLGKFEIARGGTIFLDEVGTISQSVQIKLLQVLHEHTFSRVGGEHTIDADVRIIAATNDDLLDLNRQGRFRKDLYYRLNVFPIAVPPLRERREDIPILAETFVRRLNQLYGKKIHGIDRQVMEAFQAYTWPGNIRELENVIERAYILETSNVLAPERFPTELLAFPSVVASQKANGFPSLSEARRKSVQMVERQYLREILAAHQGRIGSAAQAAGITTRQLYNLMTKYNLQKKDFKQSAQNAK
ncbi:MAG: sigma-54 dependent transcriptional regulator [Deltaproteobacteria bacterium]